MFAGEHGLPGSWSEPGRSIVVYAYSTLTTARDVEFGRDWAQNAPRNAAQLAASSQPRNARAANRELHAVGAVGRVHERRTCRAVDQHLAARQGVGLDHAVGHDRRRRVDDDRIAGAERQGNDQRIGAEKRSVPPHGAIWLALATAE